MQCGVNMCSPESDIGTWNGRETLPSIIAALITMGAQHKLNTVTRPSVRSLRHRSELSRFQCAFKKFHINSFCFMTIG